MSRRMVTQQHTRRKAPVHSFVWKVVARPSRATVALCIVALDDSQKELHEHRAHCEKARTREY